MSEHNTSNGNDEFEPRLVDRWTSGGHEVDAPIARPLFVLTGALVIITVLSGIGVSQLFQTSGNKMIETNAAKPYEGLVNYQLEMDGALQSYSQDAVDKKRFRIPVSVAIDTLVKQPGRLRAAPAPPDFVHPDDEKKK